MPQVDFALNWLAHVSAAGLRASALIGATDGKASRIGELESLVDERTNAAKAFEAELAKNGMIKEKIGK